MLVFQGTLVHYTEGSPLEILQDKVIGVDGATIVFVEDSFELPSLKPTYGIRSEDVRVLGPREFLLPGFIDAHIHPYQYVGAGTHVDQNLMDWLSSYLLPLLDKVENDIEFLEDIDKQLVKRLLKNGTTTAAYYTTHSVPGTINLCDIIESHGQRAVIGVMITRMSADEGTEKTELVTKNIRERQLQSGLIQPAVIAEAWRAPIDVLKKLAEISSKHRIHFHSHLSESVGMVQSVQKEKPSYSNDTDVFDKCGLLNGRSIIAHGVHLSEEEVQLIARRQAGIVHCPNSNISLKSGLCDVRRLEASGVRVALGTDVSGGYSASMLDAMRYAVLTSNVLKILKDAVGEEYSPLDFKDALRLATVGGSKVLGMEEKVGNFMVGKEFDALHISLDVPESPLDLFPSDTVIDMVQKFFYLGDDRNIVEVFVAGKKVAQQ